MRISDWSSDVCSSDLFPVDDAGDPRRLQREHHVGKLQVAVDDADATVVGQLVGQPAADAVDMRQAAVVFRNPAIAVELLAPARDLPFVPVVGFAEITEPDRLMVDRSEEHTSELQSLMRISYAVFCLKKKKTKRNYTNKQI